MSFAFKTQTLNYENRKKNPEEKMMKLQVTFFDQHVFYFNKNPIQRKIAFGCVVPKIIHKN